MPERSWGARERNASRRGPAAALVLPLGLAVGLALGACGGQTPSAPQGVRAWVSSAGLSGTDSTLSDDIRRIHVALGRGDLEGLHTECAVFVADVRTAIGYLPTPDSELTSYLNTAYDDYAKAASDCYESASTTDPRLSASERLLVAGSQSLTKAKARIADLTGSAVQ
jgi:hypothetical protein